MRVFEKNILPANLRQQGDVSYFYIILKDMFSTGNSLTLRFSGHSFISPP
jgi:hypothetical protein